MGLNRRLEERLMGRMDALEVANGRVVSVEANLGIGELENPANSF